MCWQELVTEELLVLFNNKMIQWKVALQPLAKIIKIIWGGGGVHNKAPSVNCYSEKLQPAGWGMFPFISETQCWCYG